MPAEFKQFSGFLNTDDSQEVMPSPHHKMARNGHFRGNGNNRRFEVSNGTVLITNNNLPAGSNQCIGSFFDSNKQRIFWFNWNSNDRHGIYQYNLKTKIVTPLLVCFVDSATDILEFSLDYPIPSVNIIYTTEEDGDILAWVARNKRPKQLNIKSAIDNLYGATWLAEYLDVAKAPPYIPIQCAYENDSTVTVNNLKNKYNKFKYRYWYGDNIKSTWSSISEMPIPVNYTDLSVDTDQTKNCRIGLIFTTGGKDVEKIEIAATENIGNTFSDFFSVQILNKSQLSIPDDDAYIWRFYNNEAYNYIDVAESILDFDRVPNLANTQELLNGNVIIYAGITEGYDPVLPDVELSTEQITVGTVSTTVQILCVQGGQSGLSTGDIRISLVGTPVWATVGTNTVVNVYIFNGVGYNNLTAQTTSPTTVLADFITQLAADAVSQGYTVVSSTGSDLVISRANQVLQNYYSYGSGNDARPINDSIPANDFSSKYNYGVVYFDEKGKTNGVVTSIDFNADIPPLNTPYVTVLSFNLTVISLLIYHRPPIWAKSYQVVRTKNLTKSTTLYWISDRTFKDAEFGYISIESLQIYKAQNPTTIIGYDFANGDRIKFCVLFNNDKTVNTNYGNTRDYEINSQVINPNINGLIQKGQFLKIKLPSTNASFDFGTNLSNQYYYYYLNLYTPAKSVAENLNVYYEHSQMYQIGNAGTDLAFHQGTYGTNQDPGGGVPPATPAILKLRKGDYYFRVRNIRAGAFFIADSVPEVTYSWLNEPVLQQTIQNIPVGTTYSVKNTISGNTTNLNNWLIKTGLTPVTFNIKGKQSFQALLTTSNALILIMQVKNLGGGGTTLVELGRITGATSGQILEFTIDINTTIPANKTAVIYLQESPVSSPTAFSAKQISGQLTFIDTEHDFTVGVIDENFSDFYPSKINSNGRPSIVNADERELYYPTLLRWGLSYEQNTNINQINRFFPLNFDEIDRSRGDIQRLITEGKLLYAYQNRAVGNFGIFSRYIQNNSGQSELISTNDIITKNNIKYLVGEYGVGDQYTGVCRAKNAHYFTDPVRGYDVRRSGDGLTPISEIYKGQFYIQPLFIPYNKTYLRTDGSKAKILKCYDFYEEGCLTVLQSGTLGSGSIEANAFSFSEKDNSYSTFFDFVPEWLMSAEDVVYSWKNGQIYSHTNTTKYANYYGVQYKPSLTLVFNKDMAIGKTFNSVGYQASGFWTCDEDGAIITSFINPQTGLRQTSRLIERDFSIQEGKYYAAFLRDENSMVDKREALVRGNVLKGNWLQIKFQYNKSDFCWLYLPHVTWSVSNRNF